MDSRREKEFFDFITKLYQRETTCPYLVADGWNLKKLGCRVGLAIGGSADFETFEILCRSYFALIFAEEYYLALPCKTVVKRRGEEICLRLATCLDEIEMILVTTSSSLKRENYFYKMTDTAGTRKLELCELYSEWRLELDLHDLLSDGSPLTRADLRELSELTESLDRRVYFSLVDGEGCPIYTNAASLNAIDMMEPRGSSEEHELSSADDEYPFVIRFPGPPIAASPEDDPPAGDRALIYTDERGTQYGFYIGLDDDNNRNGQRGIDQLRAHVVERGRADGWNLVEERSLNNFGSYLAWEIPSDLGSSYLRLVVYLSEGRLYTAMVETFDYSLAYGEVASRFLDSLRLEQVHRGGTVSCAHRLSQLEPDDYALMSAVKEDRCLIRFPGWPVEEFATTNRPRNIREFVYRDEHGMSYCFRLGLDEYRSELGMVNGEPQSILRRIQTQIIGRKGMEGGYAREERPLNSGFYLAWNYPLPIEGEFCYLRCVVYLRAGHTSMAMVSATERGLAYSDLAARFLESLQWGTLNDRDLS